MSFDAPSFKGLSRPDLVRARARLLSNADFQKAIVAGEQEARDAIRDMSEAVIATGGSLNTDEMKVSGYE